MDKTFNWNTISKQSPDNQWELITDPIQIKKYIIQRNVAHLNQVQRIPFTVNPLHTLLHNDSFTPFGQKNLDGEANLNNLNLSEIKK